MGITNLNNTHLDNAKLSSILNAITILEIELGNFNFNLSPQDRKRYGSINEQNKLLVNKVYDYNKNQPNLSAPDMDWQEFENDYNSRRNLEGMISRLNALITKMVDAKTLHDYDNYQAALDDYGFASYKAGGSAAGFQTKYADLKQFFARSGTAKKPDTEMPEL
ncbi:hypothetical protein LPB90_19325 [Chryseobacterium sp. LC2016-29]|uniref:hypothetical protein n=1 Tax=Chryseobacterium sp. LC2016-29 TaxID=2897331 RepID=UPI001E634EFE|nr:hypothetical protein [Chryseobacterium sp. LC2016-29]MCD0480599.1 hypothetical protein [Chryseobacterium sp. LC2016-29]